MNCAFSVEDYEDYTLHEPPTNEEIALFKQTGEDGPDVDNLRIDMRAPDFIQMERRDHKNSCEAMCLSSED